MTHSRPSAGRYSPADMPAVCCATNPNDRTTMTAAEPHPSPDATDTWAAQLEASSAPAT